VTLRARWVTLRARWVTLRSRWVTLRARWVTLRARWVTLRARWVTLIARWVTLRARWVTRRVDLTPAAPGSLTATVQVRSPRHWHSSGLQRHVPHPHLKHLGPQPSSVFCPNPATCTGATAGGDSARRQRAQAAGLRRTQPGTVPAQGARAGMPPWKREWRCAVRQLVASQGRPLTRARGYCPVLWPHTEA
jgi:hypothetical protein